MALNKAIRLIMKKIIKEIVKGEKSGIYLNNIYLFYFVIIINNIYIKKLLNPY